MRFVRIRAQVRDEPPPARLPPSRDLVDRDSPAIADGLILFTASGAIDKRSKLRPDIDVNADGRISRKCKAYRSGSLVNRGGAPRDGLASP